MQNFQFLAETIGTSSRLLSWFVRTVNFKAIRLLWLANPKLNWRLWQEVTLRTSQLTLSVPTVLIDFVIILVAVLLYLFSTILIFVGFAGYALFILIIKTLFDKVASPVLRILSIALAIFVIYNFYSTGAWEIISEELSILFLELL